MGRKRPRASATLPSKATCPEAMIAMCSQSRSACAITWVENMMVTPARASRRISSSSRPWLIASSPAKGSSSTMQPRLMDDRAEQLHELRHPLDRLRIDFLDQSPSPCSVKQDVSTAATFREGQAAQRAHEGDRVARVHRRIKAALLGQIADLLRCLERAVVAKHSARSARWIDDPEQHPQRRRLAGAVGPEQAVDGAGRNGEADAVDGARFAKILDEIDRFDG